MSWVCPNCSNSNEERSTHCTVCGYARPTESRSSEETLEHVDGKIVFSDFDVIKESTKSFFYSVAQLGSRVKVPKKDRRSYKRPDRERTIVEPSKKPKTEKKEKAMRVKKGFAKPWPEHKIKFDLDVIKSKGFVRSERTETNSIKGYTFYKADSNSQFIKADMLVVLHMATRL